MSHARYLGDGVYVHFNDAHQIVLTTGSHVTGDADEVIYLESEVYQALVEWFEQAACIRCHSPKQVRPSGTTPRAFYCGKCKIEFEAEDDGFVGYGDPARIVAKRERQQAIRPQGRLKLSTDFGTKQSKLKGGLER